MRLGQKLVDMEVIDEATLHRAVTHQDVLRNNSRAASRSVRELLRTVTIRVKASGAKSLELAQRVAEV